jgi:GlpG protein
MDGPFDALLQAQVWRLITPAFIHFGWLHIAFNTLWVLEFGRCIERRQGSLRLIVLFVVFALASNLAQAFFAEQLFGGMSGVIYGLLGYCFAYNKRQVAVLPCVNNGLFGFMVVWLLLCMSGIITILGFGSIANAAHVAGLLCGLACGWVWPITRESTNDLR